MVKNIIVFLMRWFMKSNYLIYLFLIISILFREPIINGLNNITSNFFLTDNNLEIKVLEKKIISY